MSTKTAVLSEEQLDAKTQVADASSIDLPPMTRGYLHGTPGTTYAIQATNENGELDAVVWAKDSKNGYLFEDVTLQPFESKGELFQMGKTGRVTVWNWTKTEYYPNPKVTFRLKAK